ncbi:hypothetical protein N7449_005074 [Penicillium cf. viridicatum]|uniref:Uncharacterized protein n=1 Tax=Penicillium cf. viridicatum TaxID=2972119 RepID=A0A9W9MKH6_9EURO|nr:hypothetical protein N7449_005074 [Penicillium cf. viridicatum]
MRNKPTMPSAFLSVLRGRVVGKPTYRIWYIMLRVESSTKRPELELTASGVSGIPRGISRAEWASSLS